MNPPSPHPTEQLSSLLTPGENPGSFPDHVPIEPWDVQAVSKDESASSTSSPLPMQEHAAYQILLDRLEQMQKDLWATREFARQAAVETVNLQKTVNQLLQAMADEDEDEQPRTYMDGSPV